jgi:hypothetical protein
MYVGDAYGAGKGKASDIGRCKRFADNAVRFAQAHGPPWRGAVIAGTGHAFNRFWLTKAQRTMVQSRLLRFMSDRLR